MRSTAAVILIIGLVSAPVAAQGRGRGGRDGAQGIPPGHLPAAGECRVWYSDRPPGHQPPPTRCRDAERTAARDPYARVIYGSDRGRSGRDEGWWEREDGRRDRDRDDDRGRAVPRRRPSGSTYPAPYPYPSRYPERNRYPYPDRDPSSTGRGTYEYGAAAYDTGYKDGYDKGREDARDNDRYDPVRHKRYRSADRGYNSRYGSRAEYKRMYRDAFRQGYDDGYRDTTAYGRDRRRGGIRLPWPF